MFLVLGWVLCLILALLAGVSTFIAIFYLLDNGRFSIKWGIGMAGLIVITAVFAWGSWACWIMGAFLYV
jgi:hypothetical protein